MFWGHRKNMCRVFGTLNVDQNEPMRSCFVVVVGIVVIVIIIYKASII